MEIPKCMDDFIEGLITVPLIIIAEVFLCIEFSWTFVPIITFSIMNILLFLVSIVDYFYLCRTIILDETGCIFAVGKRKKKYPWQEVNIQYIDNTSYLFGDSEIPGKGVVLSANTISKPQHIGAMTYCRFSHPFTSVFIRFGSSSDINKKNYAKFVYQGFCADRSELMDFLESVGVSVCN